MWVIERITGRLPEERLGMAAAAARGITISPELLSKLAADAGTLTRNLLSEVSGAAAPIVSQTQFRWELNEDAMATEKLAEGIRNFNADALRLAQIVRARMVAD